jgi:Tol biopolymer transport system component
MDTLKRVKSGSKLVPILLLIYACGFGALLLFCLFTGFSDLPPSVTPALTDLQPAPGKLVFVEGGPGHFWIMDTHGTLLRELNIGMDAEYPTWSPDGREIVFSGRTAQGAAVAVISESGSDLTILKDGLDAAAFPRWAPDGNTIVFSGADGIYMMASDGSNLRNLAPDCERCSWPAWSPDGGQIAFVSTSSDWKTDFIHVMDRNGSMQRQLAMPKGGNTHLSWSPDGKQFLFDFWPSGGDGQTNIYVLSGDGSGLKQLTTTQPGHTHNGDPTWSPDGSQIAFVSHYSKRSVLGRWNVVDPPPPGDGVYIMGWDGTGLAPVTSGDLRDARSPDWWAPTE